MGSRNRNLLVGVVVLIAVAVLFLAVLAVGQDQALFSAQEKFYLRVPNAQGLQVGSPVKLAGVQVGAVSRIRLPDGPEEHDIHVTVKIRRSYATKIRKDSEAKLRFLNPLGGERFIELTLGSFEEAVLPPNSEIQAPLSELDILLTQGTDIASNVAEVTNTLRVVFDRIEKQEGILGQLLLTPTFAEDILRDFGSAAASLKEVTGNLERGDGLLGALLSDGEFREKTTDDVATILARLDRLLTGLEDSQTPLGSLFTRDAATGEILANLQAGSDSFRQLGERLESGDGLLARILGDPEYAERVLNDLEDTARNLASITGKIERGEGTLGGMVNDPELYEGMRDVVTGMQESRFLRWMTRRYARKTRKQEAAAGGE